MNRLYTGFLHLTLSVFLIVLITGSHELRAGNLGNLKVSGWLSAGVYWDDERDVEVEGENLNGTYSVTGIYAKYGVWKLDNQLVYEEEKQFDEVKPSTKFKYNLGRLNWGKLEIGIRYNYQLRLYADYDEDTTNNYVEQEFVILTSSVDDFEDNINFSTFPNPFTDAAYLKIQLKQDRHLSISLTDIDGRTINSLADNRMNTGEHVFHIDGTGLPEGVYFINISIDGKNEVIKLLHTR